MTITVVQPEEPRRGLGQSAAACGAHRGGRVASAVARTRWARVRCRVARGLADEQGSVTAEYAIATMAAVGFAGLLVAIMRSDEVRQLLTELVRQALSFSG